MNSLLALLAAAAAQTAAPVTVPDQPALTDAIAKADAELFDLLFTTGPCDTARMRAMLADDLEFYHDKGGFNARNADEFVAMFAKNCAERQDPKAWRSRRELVRSSLHVDPVPGHGAMQAGEHLFYERKGVDGVEKLAGRARFAQVWALGADGRWRLSRVLSYAHAKAD
jgi:hypothetical protein